MWSVKIAIGIKAKYADPVLAMQELVPLGMSRREDPYL
jgi:hypothetical protein